MTLGAYKGSTMSTSLSKSIALSKTLRTVIRAPEKSVAQSESAQNCTKAMGKTSEERIPTKRNCKRGQPKPSPIT